MPNRRWFRFSLRTLFVVVTVLSVAGYWGMQKYRARQAEMAWQRAFDKWSVELLSHRDLYLASRRLLTAELAVPFFGHREAADAHLARMEALKYDWDTGRPVRMFSNLDAADRTEAQIHGYYDEAEQIAAGYR